jgi:hypothetical protein
VSDDEPYGGTLWVPEALVWDDDELRFSPEYEALLVAAADLGVDVETYDDWRFSREIIVAFLLCALSGAFVGAAIVATLWWLVG